MAPVRRPCPTASASPPSSAHTRRPPFTTPPGCSSSRSGSGLASPPSSRPPKSSPRSVPFSSHLHFNNFVLSPNLLLLLPFPLTFLTDFVITFSLSLLWPPSSLVKCGLPDCLPASVCLFMRAVVLRLCNAPSSNLSWRLMEDFWSNLLEYWLWEILIKQYISPRHSGRYHDTWAGSCNGG